MLTEEKKGKKRYDTHTSTENQKAENASDVLTTKNIDVMEHGFLT